MDLLQETLNELDKVIEALKKRDKEATELLKVLEEVRRSSLMEWMKSEDKKPEDGRELLLYYTDEEAVSAYTVGFYDTDDKVFIDLNTDKPINDSHLNVSNWAYITSPPGSGGINVHIVLEEDDGI